MFASRLGHVCVLCPAELQRTTVFPALFDSHPCLEGQFDISNVLRDIDGLVIRDLTSAFVTSIMPDLKGSLEGMIRGLSGTAIIEDELYLGEMGDGDDGQGEVKDLEHGMKQGGKVLRKIGRWWNIF